MDIFDPYELPDGASWDDDVNIEDDPADREDDGRDEDDLDDGDAELRLPAIHQA